MDLFLDSEFYPLFSATQRFEPIFQTWLKELNPLLCDSKNFYLIFWLKEYIFFGKCDSKKWTRFFSNMTQRIEPFYDSRNLTFSIQFESKNWAFFSNLTQKNWTSFMNLTPRVCFWIWLKECCFLIWHSELNLFLHMTLRPFFYITQRSRTLFFLKVTPRIELFWKYVSKNWTFFFFFKMTQRIELFFPQYYFRNWTSFSILKKTIQRFEPFFSAWLKEIEFDSKDWTFFQYDSRNWTLFFFNMTQWLDLFFFQKKYDLQEFNLLKNMTQRIELFCLIQRIELFWIWLTESHIFSNMTHRNVT